MVSLKNLGCYHILHLTTSSVGMFGGLWGSLAYLYHYDNQTAAIWALISGCMAAYVFFLQMNNTKMKRVNERTPLQYNLYDIEDPSSTTQERTNYRILLVQGLAVVGMIVSLLTGVAYFGIGYNTEGPVIPSISDLPYSYYTTSAWCFLTFVWSSMLLGASRSYRKLNNEEHQPLVQESNMHYMATM